MIDDATFGAWLRRRREEHGLALCDLCERLHLDFRALSHVEAHRAPVPDERVVSVLIKALGCDPVETRAVMTLVEWERRLPALRASVVAYPVLLLSVDKLLQDAQELRVQAERLAAAASAASTPQPPKVSTRNSRAVAAHWLSPQRRV